MGSSGSSAQAQKGHLAVHSQARCGILTESQYLGRSEMGGGGEWTTHNARFGQYSPVMVMYLQAYHCTPYCLHRQSAHAVSCSTVYVVIIWQHSRHASLTTHHKQSLWSMASTQIGNDNEMISISLGIPLVHYWVYNFQMLHVRLRNFSIISDWHIAHPWPFNS